MTDSSSTTSGVTCGDDMVDGDEECDGTDLAGEDCMMQGFDGGMLACGDDCTLDTSMCFMMDCGNDTIEGKEQCDGDDLGGETCATQGFIDGTLTCAKNCMLDTSGCNSCGNDSIGGTDVCDGTDLGGEDCVSQGAVGGTLGCLPDCSGYDLSMCDTCGNGAVDPGEDCDGADLGGADCTAAGFVDGTLGCAADCTFDTTMCGFGSGDCCTANTASPGCDDPDCVAAICLEDAFCCETNWDGLCSNAAVGYCDVCMGGMGDCCSANGTQGCNDAACVYDLCGFGGAGQDDCCTTEWDDACAATALDSCDVCIPANCGDGTLDMDELCDGTEFGGEDCISQGFDGGTLGCSANCNAYDFTTCTGCGNGVVDPGEECDGADFAGSDCISEGFFTGDIACAADCTLDTTGCGIGEGDCCVNNGSAGCDDADCVAAVCTLDAFCCDSTWDGLCAAVANGACDVCSGGAGDCCSANGSQGCEDPACVVELCGVGGAGETACCDTDWDQSCADIALDQCGVCLPANCGDGTLDMDEVCEGMDLAGEDCVSQGFDGGTLACSVNCNAFDTSGCFVCGDNVTEAMEFCDGTDVGVETCVSQGFDSGTLVCAAACDAYDTSGCGTCGNGTADGDEVCDGADLGGETCASLGLGGGTLACDGACGYDTSMCDIDATPFGTDSGYIGLELAAGMTTCDEISATGTPTNQGDDSTVTVGLGFTFPFYGNDVTDVNIDSNGALRFGETGEVGFTNSCMPSANDNSLFVFWDDLNPSAAGNIFTETLGMPGDQRFVVQYDVPNFNGDTADLMRIQVMLSEASGEIDVCYVDTVNAGNTADAGAEATAGIQQDALAFIQYSCNTADLVDGLQLRYVPN